MQTSDNQSLLAWKLPEDKRFHCGEGSPPLAPSPAYFALSGNIAPVVTGKGFPGLSMANGGVQTNLQLMKREKRTNPFQPDYLAWLDCAEEQSSYKLAIVLMYLPETQRYLRISTEDPTPIPAPFSAPRETIVLTEMASSLPFLRVLSGSVFLLRIGQGLEMHGFQPQSIFPETKWMSKSQTIVPVRVLHWDYRLGVAFTGLHPEDPKFSLIVGYVSQNQGSKSGRPWCALVPSRKQTSNLEGLVRSSIQTETSCAERLFIFPTGREVKVEVKVTRLKEIIGLAEYEIQIGFHEVQDRTR